MEEDGFGERQNMTGLHLILIPKGSQDEISHGFWCPFF
jgi:hypothetical protein